MRDLLDVADLVVGVALDVLDQRLQVVGVRDRAVGDLKRPGRLLLAGVLASLRGDEAVERVVAVQARRGDGRRSTEDRRRVGVVIGFDDVADWVVRVDQVLQLRRGDRAAGRSVRRQARQAKGTTSVRPGTKRVPREHQLQLRNHSSTGSDQARRASAAPP